MAAGKNSNMVSIHSWWYTITACKVAAPDSIAIQNRDLGTIQPLHKSPPAPQNASPSLQVPCSNTQPPPSVSYRTNECKSPVASLKSQISQYPSNTWYYSLSNFEDPSADVYRANNYAHVKRCPVSSALHLPALSGSSQARLVTKFALGSHQHSQREETPIWIRMRFSPSIKPCQCVMFKTW
jgi:hypothetical protein